MLAQSKFAIFTSILLMVLASANSRQRALGQSLGQALDEYYVKAGFVSNFASFVEWPEESPKRLREPIGICVLGSNPFGPALDNLIQGKQVDGRSLAVRQISDVRQATGCQIVFVSASEHLRLRSILETLGTQSVFSVGDTDDFITEGGIARLRLESGRVRVDINVGAAQAKHLRISSRLLQLAKNVKR